jgi:hypothetical protein
VGQSTYESAPRQNPEEKHHDYRHSRENFKSHNIIFVDGKSLIYASRLYDLCPELVVVFSLFRFLMT